MWILKHHSLLHNKLSTVLARLTLQSSYLNSISMTCFMFIKIKKNVQIQHKEHVQHTEVKCWTIWPHGQSTSNSPNLSCNRIPELKGQFLKYTHNTYTSISFLNRMGALKLKSFSSSFEDSRTGIIIGISKRTLRFY